MNQYSGAIFSGEFDQSNDSFYLTEVKSINTGSVLSENQLSHLEEYLIKQHDSCMLTVNDQIPVLLQKHEIDELLGDIRQILEGLNHSGAEGSSEHA
ncbi:hypothetical protein [Oceanobacillus salinisoli]|uniref:hypothetical protein n=1 Tax=Oceanobacillus salinisoli TaxID=2678611 RepID=UPI0012E196E0|nr:hypothetical protein [Oceanobacillus salinisoli]